MEYLYILKSYGKEQAVIKFGFTKSLHKRLSSYYFHNPFAEILFVFKANNCEDFEKTFHKNNISIIRNEWYKDSILDKLLIELQTIPNIVDITTNYKEEVITNLPIKRPSNDNTLLKKESLVFKEVVQECKKGNKEFINIAYKKYPYLEDAINIIGYDKIEQLDYHINNIQKATNRKKPYTNLQRIKEDLKLNPKFTVGAWIENSEIKSILSELFIELGFDSVAKSKDIEKIFIVKEKQKRVNKVLKWGYTILNLN